jgi:transketolase
MDDLAEALGRFRLALVVEAHYVVGGAGSLVSEVVAERGLGCRVRRCAVRIPAGGVTGSQAYLNAAHGISSASVVETALEELEALK